ncbi:hypothetical protein D3C87_1070260 [compost metagenome]
MPPESWCGYSFTRRSGSGICTRRSISTARCSASARLAFWCSCTVSAICRPTVSTGFSEVIGSWKIIEMRLPRICRISRSLSCIRSVPRRRTAPMWRPGGVGTSRRIESAVTLLPQPDSPTTPSVRPARTVYDTPSTERTVPASVLK